MTTASWVLLAVAGVVAAVDWVAVARRPSPVEYVAKPLAMVALIGVAITLDPEHDSQRAWFVVALLLSLAGDVFLLPKPDAFVPGLAAFLLGHVAYVVGFAQIAEWSSIGFLPLPFLAVAAFVVLRAVRRSEPALLGPVAFYIAVISAMLCAAVVSGDGLAFWGAICFVRSDLEIALNRFDGPRRFGPIVIMVLYHVGQGLLVLSLLP